jgi:hypothetical protein
MRLALKLHPDFTCEAVAAIEVEIERSKAGALMLDYRLAGRLSELSLPAPSDPGRADGLWEHTCFEAFVRAAPDKPYFEFNFASSLQWAAYRFASYREGMAAAEIATPVIHTTSSDNEFALQATLQLAGLPDLPNDAAWQLNLAAVIEEASGRKSYWALAHPPGKADFHHPDCFTHQLQAAQ